MRDTDFQLVSASAIPLPISHPEFHAHNAFENLLTDAVYLANSVQIFLAAVSVDPVDVSING